MKGQQGQIQQVDDAVAVDVAGEAACIAGVRFAVVIAVGAVVVGVAATVAAVGHAVGVVINRVIKAFAKITVVRYALAVRIKTAVIPDKLLLDNFRPG